MSTSKLEQALMRRRVIVCCGAGGVGKTTVSAALAVAAARRGRRVLVCTIDPARRLANSLGLTALSGEPTRVDSALLAAAGVDLAPGGELSAMMLDTRRTFDRLIERYVVDPERLERIKNSVVYQKLSSDLTGSHEYMAMEKLHELHEQGNFDLIVLDTPPTRHALDFLQAPERLARFFDASVVRWFATPTSGGGLVASVTGRIAQTVMHWLGKLFGTQLLDELAEFFSAIETLWGGFQERARRVHVLLEKGDEAGFVVVANPLPHSVQEARFFVEKLQATALPGVAVVVNRVHGSVAPERPELTGLFRSENWRQRLTRQPALGAGPLLAEAAENLSMCERMAGDHREQLKPLQALASAACLSYQQVPAFGVDVHNIAGLAALDQYLLASTRGQLDNGVSGR